MRATQVPRTSYVHRAGDFRDRGENVRPGTPRWLERCVPALDRIQPSQSADPDSDRLSLARWLVDPAHPLTARVTVNRAWQQLFGNGLVLTTENFGKQGQPPSHPALLDWLAAEFIHRDWSSKMLHHLIVTSEAYRRSSRPRSELMARDPENRLLARQQALRVPAETLRDMTLAASGLLSRVGGGPSVFPPQPERVIKEAFGNHAWQISVGANRYRRSLFTFVQRTAPFAQSTLFDAPNPNETCTRRERSNTPLQALVLLNDEAFLEAAKALSRRILQGPADGFRRRLDYAFSVCLSRLPKESERQRLSAYLTEFRTQLQADPHAVQQLIAGSEWEGIAAHDAAAWVGLSSVLLNLHEFITRE